MPRPSSPRARPADAPTITEPPTSVGKVYPPFLRSAFVPFVIVGLRAAVLIGLHAVCDCRPSCRCFLQVLETSPCRGGAAEILNL